MLKNNIINLLTSIVYYLSKEKLESAILMDAKGNFSTPFAAKCNELDLETIALSLSRIKRFFGQTDYSVAQHSVNMAKIILYKFNDKDMARQALMHEIAEYIMGDLASPLKRAFPLFSKIEEKLIEKAFKCYSISYPIHQKVKELDKRIMIDEAIYHMPNKPFWNTVGKPLSSKTNRESGVDYSSWDDDKSYGEFISMCKLLELK